MTRGLLAAALLLLPSARGESRARGQGLIYALPGGASSDTISTPTAFAAPAGVFYVGASAHTEPQARDALDAVVIMGAGTGSVTSAVEVGVVVSDVDRFAESFVTLKWHFHNETATSPALAVGIEDPTAAASHSATPYLAATKTFWDVSAPSAFLMHTTVSAGFGGGRFHRRPFGAVSASLDSFSKAIVEYDGRGVNAGVSVAQEVAPHAVAVVVFARQHFEQPGRSAWTVSLALAWQQR